MFFTGLPWGYPRANLAHVSSTHRFNILRLNAAAIRLIQSWLKHTMKSDVISFLVKHTTTTWMHKVSVVFPVIHKVTPLFKPSPLLGRLVWNDDITTALQTSLLASSCFSQLNVFRITINGLNSRIYPLSA